MLFTWGKCKLCFIIIKVTDSLFIYNPHPIQEGNVIKIEIIPIAIAYNFIKVGRYKI